jgi:hypothetical protein
MNPEVELAKALGSLPTTEMEKLSHAFEKMSIAQLEALIHDGGQESFVDTAAREVSLKEKIAMADSWGREMAKHAYLSDSGSSSMGKSWASQFEGTPYFTDAIRIQEQELKLEVADTMQRQSDDAKYEAENTERKERNLVRDQIRLQKSALELELLRHKSGEEDQTKVSFLSTPECVKEEGGGGSTTWASQFEGTPLFDHAIKVQEQDLKMEVHEAQKRAMRDKKYDAEEAERKATNLQRDHIRLQKNALELALMKHKAGTSGAGAAKTASLHMASEKLADSWKEVAKSTGKFMKRHAPAAVAGGALGFHIGRGVGVYRGWEAARKDPKQRTYVQALEDESKTKKSEIEKHTKVKTALLGVGPLGMGAAVAAQKLRGVAQAAKPMLKGVGKTVALGAAGGALGGALAPGKNAQGQTNSRIGGALKGGVLGGALGAGAGAVKNKMGSADLVALMRERVKTGEALPAGLKTQRFL